MVLGTLATVLRPPSAFTYRKLSACGNVDGHTEHNHTCRELEKTSKTTRHDLSFQVDPGELVILSADKRKLRAHEGALRHRADRRPQIGE